jgi:PKD repeat protein
MNFTTPLTRGTVELYLTGDFDADDEGYTLTIEGVEVYSKNDIGFQDEPLASSQADAHFIGTFSLPSSAIGKTRITIVGKTTSTVNNGQDPAARAWIVVGLSGYVNQSPIADFTWELTTGNEVRFDASTSHDPDGHIVSYKWDFDNDGSWDHVSSNPVITHTFPHRLACRTELMVVDDQGQTGTIVRTPYLPPISPTASFTWEGLSPEGSRLLVKPKAGDRIRFAASASSDPDGQIVKYEWDWDSDGEWDKETLYPTIEHSFIEAGTYQVTLRVTDNDGLTGQSTQAVVIERGDIIQADFTFRVLNKALHQIQFDASASTDTMGTIVRYEWDWNNDGSYDTAVEVPTIMNRFPEAGPYQITLTIVDDQENRASCTKEVP